jgi:deoxyribonuclease-4
MLTIGCHLSTDKGFLHMAQEAVSINANTFQYFTRNPRGGSVRQWSDKDIQSYRVYADAHGISKIMGYAPYTIEPASSDTKKIDFAKAVMFEDLQHMDAIPNQFYLVRPGSVRDSTLKAGISNIIQCLNSVMYPNMKTKILLDTMPGEGHQLGYKFDQLAKIIYGLRYQGLVGVCFDVSAVWAAGYDVVGHLNEVFEEFDKTIGLNYLCAVHLNDSKEALGSKVNRHAAIGKGQIGFNALANIVKHPRLEGIPFYLEDYDATLVTYERDIARFRAIFS